MKDSFASHMTLCRTCLEVSAEKLELAASVKARSCPGEAGGFGESRLAMRPCRAYPKPLANAVEM